MISTRTLLLLFGFVLFLLLGVIGLVSDSINLFPSLTVPFRRPSISAYVLWFAFGSLYLPLTLASLSHDFSRRKKKP
jgi:hypothetical protein